MHELTDYTGAKHALKQGTGNCPPYDVCEICSLRGICRNLEVKCDTAKGQYYTSAPTVQPLHGDVASGTF